MSESAAGIVCAMRHRFPLPFVPSDNLFPTLFVTMNAEELPMPEKFVLRTTGAKADRSKLEYLPTNRS